MGRVERIEGSTPHQLLNQPGARMRWSVLWYIPKEDRIKRIRCGEDLNEAVRLYQLALRGGKRLPTLRCDNFAFPPPEKYRPHSVYVIQEETYRTPKGKKKKREVRTVEARVPMDAANRKGIFWCPYCRELRRFQMQSGFMHDGRWVPEPDKRGGLYCPMCGVSHRDFNVRRWNPIADRHYLSSRRGRGRS